MSKGSSSPRAPAPSEFRIAQYTPQGSLVFGRTGQDGEFVFDPSAASAAASVQESPFMQGLRLRQEDVAGTLATTAQNRAREVGQTRFTNAGLPGIPGFTGGGFNPGFGFQAGGGSNSGFRFPSAGSPQFLTGGATSGGGSIADRILSSGGVNYVRNNIGDFGDFGLTLGRPAGPDPATTAEIQAERDALFGDMDRYRLEAQYGPDHTAYDKAAARLRDLDRQLLGGEQAGQPAIPASTVADIEAAIRDNSDLQAELANRLGLDAASAAGGAAGVMPGDQPSLQDMGLFGFDVGGGGFGGGNAADSARRSVEDATFQRLMNVAQPQFDRAENRLRQNLANRGQPIAAGTAGGDEFGIFEEARQKAITDASLASLLAGADEYARQVGLAQGVRGQLFGERQGVRNQNFNELAALLGGQQVISGGSNFQLPNPGDAADAANASRIAASQNAARQQSAGLGGLFGLASAALPFLFGPAGGAAALGGVGGGGAASTIPVLSNMFPRPCWVAREVYGIDNPRWLVFREWMLSEAPQWLRKVYLKHGPRWAAWISDKPTIKRGLRVVMDWIIRGR